MVNSLSELRHTLKSGIKGKREGASSAQTPIHSENNGEPYKIEYEMEWGMNDSYSSSLSVRKTISN